MIWNQSRFDSRYVWRHSVTRCCWQRTCRHQVLSKLMTKTHGNCPLSRLQINLQFSSVQQSSMHPQTISIRRYSLIAVIFNSTPKSTKTLSLYFTYPLSGVQVLLASVARPICPSTIGRRECMEKRLGLLHVGSESKINWRLLQQE